MNLKPFAPVDPNDLRGHVTLSRPVSAIQLVPGEVGITRLGLLSELRTGETLEFCGEGFNSRTAKVRVHGNYFFVFLQDFASAANPAWLRNALSSFS